MGGWGSVARVLEAAKDGTTITSTPPTDDDDISDDDLASRLSGLGVEPGGSDSREDMLRCYRVLLDDDFWRGKYELHENRKRVKNWMWVHDKYRGYVDALVRHAEGAAASGGGARVDSALRKIRSDFKKVVGKMRAHSQFEDTQLFRFFAENGDVDVSGLVGEHADGSFEDRVWGALASGADGVAEVAASLEDYAVWMKCHMEHEERALVRRWLTLSKEEYKKYRGYLSWKYSVIY